MLLKGRVLARFEGVAEAGRVYTDVVEVRYADIPSKSLKRCVHQSAHVRGATLNAEGQVVPLVFLAVGDKSGDALIFLFDGKGPKARREVEGGQEEGACRSRA